MIITNAAKDIAALFPGGRFDLHAWHAYARAVSPALDALCTQDMNACIASGRYTFDQHFLPVLQAAYANDALRMQAIASFETVTNDLAQRIIDCFGRVPEARITLYLGLCNGAGWVTTLDGTMNILLGIEKIMELDWCGIDDMYGLVYHELGHVYQQQYGVLERSNLRGADSFLWQLFTEGVAMYFEQQLKNDTGYYHQDKNGWKEWCDAHFAQIISDFAHDLPAMTRENQRYFGDWVSYSGHGDVGYYLGARFVQWICRDTAFDVVLSYDLPQIKHLFCQFTGEHHD